jgi:hypothetical protein
MNPQRLRFGIVGRQADHRPRTAGAMPVQGDHRLQWR